MSGNNQPIICIEGNGKRPSHKGKGYTEGGVQYTLNTRETHCVAYKAPGGGGKAVYQKVTGTLSAQTHPGGFTGQDAYNDLYVIEELK